MPRIEPVELDKTDPSTADALAGVKAKLGVLPNIFTTFARSPAALNGYLQFSDAVAGGRLTSRQRELISIAVAQENSCDYCLSAHAAIGKMVGLGEEAIRLAREGCAANPVDDAIVAFALRVVAARGGVSDADLEAARKAGADDALIIEIVANVVLNILTNYVNRVAETDVDFPPVDLNSAA